MIAIRKHGSIWTEFLIINNGKTKIRKTFIYCEFHGKSGLLDAGGEIEWRKNHANCPQKSKPEDLPILRTGSGLVLPTDKKPKAMRKAA